MNKKSHTAAGFTLVELLVVIVIIGILAGITFSGADYLLGAQDEKQAKSHIEALSLALDQYKSEKGGYPRTDSISNEEDVFKCGEFLLFALKGAVGKDGEPIAVDERRKSFLPGDALVLGKQEGKRSEVFTPEESDWQSNSGETFFAMDPWNEPYIYQFPRKDGHKGFLLFSKGPDGQSSIFNQELSSIPQKENIDEDNIPASEPGKW